MSSRPLPSSAQQFAYFPEFLASTLRVGTKLRVYHISTPPSSVPPIYATPPGQQNEPTTCESHFLAVSQKHVNQGDNDTSVNNLQDDVFILGIEVLIFSTRSLTTIFISKADSTGFLTRPRPLTQSWTPISQIVISTFVEWLVACHLSTTTSETTEQGLDPLHIQNNGTSEGRLLDAGHSFELSGQNRKRIVLSLFARSQNQYLFPGSVENTTKHVLDDRQLIRWWCKLLHGLIQKDWDLGTQAQPETPGTSSNGTQHGLPKHGTIRPEAFVIVPGCDRSEVTRSFFPSSTSYGTARWHNQYPGHLLVGSEKLPTRCMIPRLPDDPKSRYCDDLDISIDEKGQWRDIKTLQQFWETMEYRQECAAGRLVGFIWVVFDPSKLDGPPAGVVSQKDRSMPVEVSNGYIGSTDVRLPLADRGRPADVITLTSEQYIELSDLLINKTDFAGVELAVKSTKEWIDQVKELSGASKVGVSVEGQLSLQSDHRPIEGQAAAQGSGTTSDMASTPPVNILRAVKKRKRVSDGRSEQKPTTSNPAYESVKTNDQPGAQAASQEAGTGTADLLSNNLDRKKSKLQL